MHDRTWAECTKTKYTTAEAEHEEDAVPGVWKTDDTCSKTNQFELVDKNVQRGRQIHKVTIEHWKKWQNSYDEMDNNT